MGSPLPMWPVCADSWSSSVGRSLRFASVIESGLESGFSGGRRLVYGWCAQPVACSGPYLSKSLQPPSVWPGAQSSCSMKGLGRTGERDVRLELPSGAVSPMKIASRPCPVRSSERRPAKYSERYNRGEYGLPCNHCGVSQPPWLGSLPSAQTNTRGIRGGGRSRP